ncbi:odorant receptor 10-like [Linepithema humile]|uniref:odorant receptor 10-like n=1 Tax=Linepithema humile TaxID=83485 RepID=UPI00351DF37D
METSKYLEYQDFEWAVKLNRYCLEIAGLWPKSDLTAWNKVMCNLRTLLVFFSILFGLLIPMTHSLIKISGDIILIIDNLQFTLPIISTMLKIAIFWWKKEAVISIMDMIANDWRTPKTPWEKMKMITRAQTARTITKFAYCLVGGNSFALILMPVCNLSVRYITNITDPGRLLPLQTHYIYDTTKSPHYELTFISQSICLFLCMIHYIGIDSFFSFLVLHICGQLDILRNRILHLEIINYAYNLKMCVTDHTRLLRSIVLVEHIFNIMMLALFLYFGILFSFYGFLILNLSEGGNDLSIFRAAYLICIIINFVCHSCVYCAVGEILLSQCKHIHYAVYSNKWYNLEPRNSRNMILLMVRTNEPVYLTAGRLFPLTMSTFCNLLKTSASYISVLLTTKQ